MPEKKLHTKKITLPASFREQIDSHYGTWVNMPYLTKLIRSPEFWQKRYQDLADHVFRNWSIEEHLLLIRKPTGRPKGNHVERDSNWLSQMDGLVAGGMSQRKASGIIAKLPEACRDNVTAKTILNAVIRLRKSEQGSSTRRADAVTPAQR